MGDEMGMVWSCLVLVSTSPLPYTRHDLTARIVFCVDESLRRLRNSTRSFLQLLSGSMVSLHSACSKASDSCSLPFLLYRHDCRGKILSLIGHLVNPNPNPNHSQQTLIARMYSHHLGSYCFSCPLMIVSDSSTDFADCMRLVLFDIG
jgi:hypothetical protein